MILAGDIGGTKTVLALYTRDADTLVLQRRRSFSSRGYRTFSDVIAAFFESSPPAPPAAACFGVAGPVINGVCRTTNLPWEIAAADLQKQLGTADVTLLNDLEATAFGMLHLNEENFVSLNPGAKRTPGNRAVIAAGTGLGEAFLIYDGRRYRPVGSEGGHSDFAPADAQQDALLQWLRGRYGSHVSYERILSGPGLYTLYEFVLQSGFAPAPDFMKSLPPGADKSAAVSEGALKHRDPLCTETLRLFCTVYGAEAGNLALKCLALGGVYVGGGIAPKILPFLQAHFMDSFTAKGRFRGLLENMEVKVSLEQDTALLGAAYFAAQPQ